MLPQSVASLSYTNTVTTSPLSLISPPYQLSWKSKILFPQMPPFSALPVLVLLPRNERNPVQD